MDARNASELDMALHAIGGDVGTLEQASAKSLSNELPELMRIQNRIGFVIERIKIQEKTA